jgi:hypothetical protein
MVRENDMRKTLTILIAVVLLSLNFTFSSCKSCNKNKGKDDGDNNPITDRNQISEVDMPEIEKHLCNPRYREHLQRTIATPLSEVEISEVKRHLCDKGASNAEIEEMINIGRRGCVLGIGRIIVAVPEVKGGVGHFYYRDTKGTAYEGHTYANCGLYAMKRYLFVLGRHGEVSKTLWYEYTDQELRDKMAALPGGEKFRSQDSPMGDKYLVTLMISIDVPIHYCKVYCKTYGGGK